MNTILVDCDGVLLNWRDPFDAWMMREHGVYAMGDVRLYDQAFRYEMSREEIMPYILQFNSSANIGFLPPLYDSVKYVKKLHEECGCKFLVISSLSMNPHAQTLRTMNLKNIFGEQVFEEFVYLDTGADKDEVLSKYSDWYQDHYWIEDKVQNAILGKELGLQSLLMKHPHIKMEDPGEIPLMSNWKDVYETISG